MLTVDSCASKIRESKMDDGSYAYLSNITVKWGLSENVATVYADSKMIFKRNETEPKDSIIGPDFIHFPNFELSEYGNRVPTFRIELN